MHLRRKVRNRIIIVLVTIFVVIYWRGTNVYTEKNKLDCKRHLAYAVCKQIGQPTEVPSLFDILKEGVKF